MSDKMLRRLLDPLAGLLSDTGTTDVIVNRPTEIGVQTNGKWVWHSEPYLTFERLWALAITVAYADGQEISEATPICSTSLPTGERVDICSPPVTAKGIVALSIRRPAAFRPRLTSMGPLSEETGTKALEAFVPPDENIDRLRQAVIKCRNILVTGSTGSGKSTYAQALAEEIPLESRIVTVEAPFEWKLPHRNWVPLRYSKGDQSAAKGITAERLVETALRMAPDRILIQELRDAGAATAYLRSVCTGHPGAITTLHADPGAAGAFDSLRRMLGKPLDPEDKKLIHVIVHCERDERTKEFRRTVTWL
jgi:type IV secretion system protein VirB11